MLCGSVFGHTIDILCDVLDDYKLSLISTYQLVLYTSLKQTFSEKVGSVDELFTLTCFKLADSWHKQCVSWVHTVCRSNNGCKHGLCAHCCLQAYALNTQSLHALRAYHNRLLMTRLSPFQSASLVWSKRWHHLWWWFALSLGNGRPEFAQCYSHSFSLLIWGIW